MLSLALGLALCTVPVDPAALADDSDLTPPDTCDLARYEALVDSAAALARTQALDASLTTFAEAFSVAPPDRWDAYRAARTAARAGRIGRAAGYLHQSIEAGMALPGFAVLEADFDTLRAYPALWSEITDAFYRADAQRYPETYNEALARTLTQIYVEDQRIRRTWTAAGREHGYPIPDSILAPIRTEMIRVDSVQLVRVQEILDMYGWPGISEVGAQGATAVFIVIQHAPLDVQERYLPIMEAAVEAGEAEASNFVLLVDRVRVHNGIPQLYGTQRWTDPETGIDTYFPIEDGIEERLAALGLTSFREAVERRGHAWPVRTGWRPDDSP